MSGIPSSSGMPIVGEAFAMERELGGGGMIEGGYDEARFGLNRR